MCGPCSSMSAGGPPRRGYAVARDCAMKAEQGEIGGTGHSRAGLQAAGGPVLGAAVATASVGLAGLAARRHLSRPTGHSPACFETPWREAHGGDGFGGWGRVLRCKRFVR